MATPTDRHEQHASKPTLKTAPGVTKLNAQKLIILGLMLFGLFFGAGNTIFPVRLGLASGAGFIPATIGFLLTAIGLPLLGVVSFSLSQANQLQDYAGVAGRPFALAYTVALFLTIGPLFAVPRTATVAFQLTFPQLPPEKTALPLLVFSLLFFALTLYLALKPTQLMDIVGKYLTPLFLILISILLITVILKPAGQAGQAPAQGVYTTAPFLGGFIGGYETMDALASLAFSTIVISNLKSLGINRPGRRATETLKSGLIMLLLMSLIYSALTYLGAVSAGLIEDPAANGGQILALVSRHYFGLPGQLLLAAIISVACLKTAIGLVVSLGDMFGKLFPGLRQMTYARWAILFVVISFAIANFGLNTILAISEPVLIFLYPLTIVLIFLHLVNKPIPLKPLAFRLTLLLTGLFALPEALKKVLFLAQNSTFKAFFDGLSARFPLFDKGLGWLLPASLGLVISLLFCRKKRA